LFREEQVVLLLLQSHEVLQLLELVVVVEVVFLYGTRRCWWRWTRWWIMEVKRKSSRLLEQLTLVAVRRRFSGPGVLHRLQMVVHGGSGIVIIRYKYQ
jgi:hypothetical protein